MSEPVTSTNSNTVSGSVSVSNTSADPGRKYTTQLDPKNRNDFRCHFCGNIYKGGVYRIKCHFVGGFSSVVECSSCPSHVKEETKAYMQQKEVSKVENLMNSRMDFDVGGDNDCVEVKGGTTKVSAKKNETKRSSR